MNSKKLLVIGELNVDLILNNIKGFPKVGTEIIADTMNFTLGSSSAIMASNISAMGINTSFCGIIGDDEFGKFVLEELQSKNVDTRFITKKSNLKTGITIVMNYDQDRANITYCGAMNFLTINDIPWESINTFSHFHLSSYFLQKGIKKDITNIFRKAKVAGLTTSLDLQYDPDHEWKFDYKSCLPYVDIFFPNKVELLALTKEINIDLAIEELRPHTNIIALKLGEEGSRLISGEEEITLAPFLNDVYKDSIGAGDSFNAGFIEKFLEGAPLEKCLLNANLMGSMSTTKAGGTAAFSSKEAIDKQKQQILNQQL